MTSDLNKGITDIQYNCLNLPQLIEINSPNAEARVKYTYSASGQKLRVDRAANLAREQAPVTGDEAIKAIIGQPVRDGFLGSLHVTDYVGNKVYEQGNLRRILVDGGYIEGGIYHFYITDHLGNNRTVLNSSGGVVQDNHYYPFGMFFSAGTNNHAQPYKYNGKELDQMHGLNLYDYSARHYEPAIGRFTTVDPLAEKYYSWSPYVYVMNNPLKYIDPDGQQAILPFPFPTTFLGNSNPMLPMGRNIGMLGSADKIVRVTSKTGESKLNQTRLQSGRNVEAEQLQKLGLEKNTESFTRIDPKTGKEGTTIPDAIKDGQTVEIKNVKQQGLSKQLRLQEKLSNENGKKPLLHINKDAKLTKPLQNSFEISTYGNSSVIVPDNIKTSAPTLRNPVQEQQDAQKYRDDAAFRKARQEGWAL